MSTLEVSLDSENKLLSRREIVGTFLGGSGLISRQSAAEALSTRLGVPKDNVHVISLMGKFGTRDLLVRAYVFSDKNAVKAQLPRYMHIRQLSKDDRKKAREELKKAKAPAPAAAEKKK